MTKLLSARKKIYANTDTIIEGSHQAETNFPQENSYTPNDATQESSRLIVKNDVEDGSPSKKKSSIVSSSMYKIPGPNSVSSKSHLSRFLAKFTKKSISRVAVVFAFFFVATYIMALVQVVMNHVHYFGTFGLFGLGLIEPTTEHTTPRYVDHEGWKHLVESEYVTIDAGFLLDKKLRKTFADWPAEREFFETADEYLQVLVLSTVALCLFFHDKGVILFRRVLFFEGFHNLLRAVTLYVTLLPPCENSCPHGSEETPNPKWDENFFVEAFKILQRTRITCVDLMFSGHTCWFLNSLLTWIFFWDGSIVMQNINSAYEKDKSFLNLFVKIMVGPVLKLCISLFAILGIVYLTFGKMHYTVDVCVATMIVFLSWGSYYGALNVILLERRLKKYDENSTHYFENPNIDDDASDNSAARKERETGSKASKKGKTEQGGVTGALLKMIAWLEIEEIESSI